MAKNKQTPNKKIDSDIIISPLQFWKKVYNEEEVIIKFTKKDNSERVMRCTLDFKKIPKKDHPKNINISKTLKLIQKNKIIRVWDLDKKGWRSVPFERVKYMDTSTRRYNIKK